MMAPKFQRFMKVFGILNRCNDIIYSSPLTPSTTSTNTILVFFCGDTQDFSENMVQHRTSVGYQEWSLENTGKLMANHFPQNHILIIRPSRREILSNGVLNCFDNFVSGSESGIPTFCPDYQSLLHLKSLLQSLSNQKPENLNRIMNEGELSLMGFSKGTVVLNQFLHEFHNYQNMQEGVEEIMKFISRIKEMWWLDGGHQGQKDTWITDKIILDSFIKMGIDVHVHVSPYQTRDDCRPWIGIEEQIFVGTLKKGGANIQHFLHFRDQPRKLERHFEILKQIRNVPK